MEARLALLFREVLEKCGTMSANAFVAVELTSGERLWAANGPFKEEFRNQGRIVNEDDVEIDVGVVLQTELMEANDVRDENYDDVEDDDDIDDEDDDAAAVPRKSSSPAVQSASASVVNGGGTVAGNKRKNGAAKSASPQAAKKARTTAEPTSSMQNQTGSPPKPNDDKPAPSKEKPQSSKSLWHGEEMDHWLNAAAEARRKAVEKHRKWHQAHPSIEEPDWHLASNIKWRLASLNDPTYKTSAFGFWGNLKQRKICDKCLCVGAGAGRERKKHVGATCDVDCCGLRRCRLCAHAHEPGTPCLCTCWTDSLKALKIIHDDVGIKIDFPSTAEPVILHKAAATAGSVATKPGKAGPLRVADEIILGQAKKVGPLRWKGKELGEHLRVADDIILRQAKKDHEPLHDVSSHLKVWMEKAAVGKYYNFFSHVLVNKFCHGCCCFVGVSVRQHGIHACEHACCGRFLCKICLHYHPVDRACDCRCVQAAVIAVGLDLSDAPKLQRNTKAKWENIQKETKAQVAKTQVAKTQVAKTQVEKTQVEKTQVEKTQVEKTQATQVQEEKSQATQVQVVKAQETKEGSRKEVDRKLKLNLKILDEISDW